jgi:hypothetical protein
MQPLGFFDRAGMERKMEDKRGNEKKDKVVSPLPFLQDDLQFGIREPNKEEETATSTSQEARLVPKAKPP